MNSRTLKKHLRYIVPEMRLALIREPGGKALPVNCPSDVEKILEPLKHADSENFVALHLSTRNEVIGYALVSRGTIGASLVHCREVFKAAIIANSHALIVAHNHPGGSLTPSPDDLQTTKMLIAAGDLLGIKLVDHIIVSAGGICSMRETQDHLWLAS